jgi:tRNA threonylcarbamoyladenosine biosynthesis protein TsaB
LILAIESATPHGSVALVRGGALEGEAVLPAGRQASETLLEAGGGLFRRLPADPESVSHVAVSAGPGSFTGLRVGMAAAKGFCFGWGVPLVPVPTLHALASRMPAADGGTIVPILDAKKKEVYAALFRRQGERTVRLSPDMALDPGALADRIRKEAPAGEVRFCGDGIAPYGALLRGHLGRRAVFPPEGEGLPRAAAVGLMAVRLIEEGRATDPRSVVPAYIRPSEAEIKRAGRPAPGGA